NLRQPFEHQYAVVNVLRDWHQLDGMFCLPDGQFFSTQSCVDLSEDCNRPRVFRFHNQSLLQNRTRGRESSDGTSRIAFCLRNQTFKPSLWEVEAEVDVLEVLPWRCGENPVRFSVIAVDQGEQHSDRSLSTGHVHVWRFGQDFA